MCCSRCERQLVDRAHADGPGDPRIDCGGECLACVWSVEEGDPGRIGRPDNFEVGMPDDRVWQPAGEDPRPIFVLSAPEVRLLIGDLSDYDNDSERAMAALLEFDQRMRDWLGSLPSV